jgi:hypothetical protein
LPAAFGEVEAEAALTFEAVDEGDDRVEVDEVILAGPLADEEAEAEADPLDIDIDIEELALMLIELDMLEFEDMDEFDDIELAEAEALGIAARLADPPPIVEKGVHWEVAPAGWGAGVVGSPWLKVEPEYTPGASSVGSPSQLSNPGSNDPGMVKPQLTTRQRPCSHYRPKRERRLTDIVDMLTVGRGFRSIDTCSDTEVVYPSALNQLIRERVTYWKT